MIPRRDAAFVVLLLLTPVSCPRDDPRPDVLLVTIDTLRWDRLGCTGHPAARTPTLDRLASEGVLFDQVVVAAPLTLPSHATLMTGLDPIEHGARDNPPFRLADDAGETLAERFVRSGYQTLAVVGGEPLRRGSGLERGFETFDDRFPSAASGSVALGERDADAVTDAALDLLGRRDARRPVFLWVHYFDPHAPYAPPRRYLEQGLDPYDGEIAHVDDALGRLLDRFDVSGRPSLLVVTADHGEAFGEHGEEAHGFLLHDATVRVALIVRDPAGPRGLRVREQVRERDLPGWIFDRAIGRAGPADRALPEPGRRGEPAFLESLYGALHCDWAELRGLRYPDGWKYLESCVERLFDLAHDAGEDHDLVAREPDRVARARADLARALARTRPMPAPRGGTLPGYLGTPSLRVFSRAPSREENCSKDSIFEKEETLRLLQEGVRLCDAALFDAAAESLERAAALDPGNPAVRFWLGRSLLRSALASGSRRRARAAAAELREALELRPRQATARDLLLWVDLQLGRYEEARTLASSIDPAAAGARSLEAAALLHLVERGRFAREDNPHFDPRRAEPLLERALELGEDPRIRRRLEECHRLLERG